MSYTYAEYLTKIPDAEKVSSCCKTINLYYFRILLVSYIVFIYVFIPVYGKYRQSEHNILFEGKYSFHFTCSEFF